MKGFNFLYVADFGSFIKVGVSTNVKKRIASVGSLLNFKCVKFQHFICDDAYKVEEMIKFRLIGFHFENEKIKTELFSCGFDHAVMVTDLEIKSIAKPKKIKIENKISDTESLLKTMEYTQSGFCCSRIGNDLSEFSFNVCCEISKYNQDLSREIMKMSSGERLIHCLLWKNKELENLKDEIQGKLDFLD